jgi:hypothetical protein
MKTFKLDKEPKIATGFKVPDSYFDDFQSKIDQRLQENETQTISLFAKRKTWFFTAAAVFIMALSIPSLNIMQSSSTDIDKDTLERYLSNQTNLSNDDIVELLNEEDIQKMKIDLKIEDQELEDILSTNCNIEEYIVD